MAAYEFIVRGVGIGNTEEEAWEDVREWLIEKIQRGEYADFECLDEKANR